SKRLRRNGISDRQRVAALVWEGLLGELECLPDGVDSSGLLTRPADQSKGASQGTKRMINTSSLPHSAHTRVVEILARVSTEKCEDAVANMLPKLGSIPEDSSGGQRTLFSPEVGES